MNYELILPIVSVAASLTAGGAVFIYYQHVPKGEKLQPWLLILLGMWLIAFSELARTYIPHNLSPYNQLSVVFFIGGELLLTVAIIRLFSIEYLQTRKKFSHLELLAYNDELSGLPNRRAFNQHLDQELRAAAVYGHSLSLALFDLDYFKKVNDSLGHPSGDAAIRFFANIMRSTIRVQDQPARLGGDEFALILPKTSVEEAVIVVDRIRQTLHDTPLVWGEHSYSLTCSVGIASHQGGKLLMDGKEFYSQADKALYQAKRGGRNKVDLHQNS